MKLTLLVLDGVQALDVAGPLDVFAGANQFLDQRDRYEVTLVGAAPGHVASSSGMELKVHCDYRHFDSPSDLLLLAGGPRFSDYRPEPALLDWIGEQAHGAARFGAVCNGVFLLAHAGLLEGREITTHWDHAERLASQFPGSTVRPDKIFVRDGKVFTCGGVTAGIDLCLALVAEDWGHELAMKVAKGLIVYMRRDGGQSQYSPYLAVGPEEDSLVAKALKHVKDHISDALTIEEIADAVGVSRRTFSRVFAKHTGVTPSIFVDQVHIDFARKLLEETDLPMKTVAFRSGFHSAARMRMTFSRQLSTTPKLYRERYRNNGTAVAIGGNAKYVPATQTTTRGYMDKFMRTRLDGISTAYKAASMATGVAVGAPAAACITALATARATARVTARTTARIPVRITAGQKGDI